MINSKFSYSDTEFNKIFAGLFPRVNTYQGIKPLLSKNDIFNIFLEKEVDSNVLASEYKVSRSTINRIKDQIYSGNTTD